MTDEPNRASAPLLLAGHTIWAIRRDVLPHLVALQRQYGHNDWSMPAQAATRRVSSSSSSKRISGAVEVIPLCGVITPKGSWLSMLFGGGSGGLNGFREQFAAAVADPETGAIVLEIDSPGGQVSLVPEVASVIRAARGEKPIIAVCNTLAASAAYWLAAQADEIVCTPSGEAGSVGVYMVHDDYSAMNEKIGVDVTYVSAGKFKTEGNMDEPLSDAAKAAWQAEVDDLYAMFLADVGEGRGISADKVKSDYGQGRCLLAAKALEAGMIDRVDTIDTVIAELLGQEPDAAEDGATARLVVDGKTVAIFSPTALAAAEDQPRCSECGKYLAAGETTCESCEAAKAEEDDEDEPDDDEAAEAEAEASDEDEDDDENEPSAESKLLTALHFG